MDAEQVDFKVAVATRMLRQKYRILKTSEDNSFHRLVIIHQGVYPKLYPAAESTHINTQFPHLGSSWYEKELRVMDRIVSTRSCCFLPYFLKIYV